MKKNDNCFLILITLWGTLGFSVCFHANLSSGYVSPVLLTPFYNRSLKNKSHISNKDTTHFINFIENTPLPDGAVLATLDVSSLYTNIPQEEGIEVVCQYYQEHYQSKTPIPKQSLGDLMRLILKENSFKFNDKHYLQTHGIAMGTN